MMMDYNLTLGYDLDKWNYYGVKEKVKTDISLSTNSHILICGMAGSGKSYFQTQLFARLAKADTDSEFYFADYKREDAFSHLYECKRYYCYNDTLEALDIVYNRMKQRQSGEDRTRNFLTLLWDEYVANILALLSTDKKQAETVMRQVSEILMMGRSMGVRIILSCQRADAIVFQAGARLNFGVIVILGAFVKSTYEMLMTDHIEQIKTRDHNFGRGEGSILVQGSQLHFVKVGQTMDMEKVQDLCCSALG